MVCRETKLLRAVIREDMSMSMVDELIKDITRAVEYLDNHFTINVNDVHKPEGKSLAVSLLTALFAVGCRHILHASDFGSWYALNREHSPVLHQSVTMYIIPAMACQQLGGARSGACR